MKTTIKEFFLNLFLGNRIISAEYKDKVMAIKYERGEDKQYEGECTVWHRLPYMQRCNTLTEQWLCNLWKYNIKWGGAYPNAHKNKLQ